MDIRRPIALLLFLSLLPAPAFAWGRLGHWLVGELASYNLNPPARAQVELLLKGEQDPTLAGIASWADDLRKNDPVLGRTSARWHFVNIGEHDCAYEQVRDCPGGNCVVEAIRTQAAVLADPKRTHAERLQALGPTTCAATIRSASRRPRAGTTSTPRAAVARSTPNATARTAAA